MGRLVKKLAYDYCVLPLMAGGYRLFALLDAKAKEYFEIREGMFEVLSRRRDEEIMEDRPPALFHAASVGELLQAMPVMAALKEKDGAPAVALSFTSPSVLRNMPCGVAADIMTPSPIDTTSRVGRFLDIMAPGLMVFSTYDIWPNLLIEATDRGIPAILINATLPENSGRLKFPARSFFRWLYPRLAVVGAITEEDAARFPRLGVTEERVRVTGNCRFDQTLARCRSVKDDDPDISFIPEADLVMVAGSTWPEDHARLLPALKNLMQRHKGLGAVIAPHEPDRAHVEEVEGFFEKAAINTARYSRLKQGADSGRVRVTIVDTVGVLYKLYRRGDAAYVGGGFRQGVHNVMEPAGMGLPVLTGPVHENSAEALQMINSGGAVAANDAAGLEAALGRWIGDPASREEAGSSALSVVERNAGATQRTVALVEEFLS
jgi:3-deoxy-D-manno-octulosonic-acid transferase